MPDPVTHGEKILSADLHQPDRDILLPGLGALEGELGRGEARFGYDWPSQLGSLCGHLPFLIYPERIPMAPDASGKRGDVIVALHNANPFDWVRRQQSVAFSLGRGCARLRHGFPPSYLPNCLPRLDWN